MFLRLLAAGTLFTLFSLAVGQVEKGSGGYQMRILWEPNEVHLFEVVTRVNPEDPVPSKRVGTLTYHVESVDEQVASVYYTLSAAGLPGGGKVGTVGIDSRGAVVRGSLGNSEGLPVFPEQRIARYGEWRQEQVLNFNEIPVRMSVTYQPVAEAVLGGRPVLHVKMTLRAFGNGIAGKGEGDMYVVMEDGLPQRTTYRLDLRIGQDTRELEVPVEIDIRRQT
ncbi:MAG: hypothetical protein ACOCX1_01585 [Fimbriimonadaceae bacterium]